MVSSVPVVAVALFFLKKKGVAVAGREASSSSPHQAFGNYTDQKTIGTVTCDNQAAVYTGSSLFYQLSVEYKKIQSSTRNARALVSGGKVAKSSRG